MLGKADSITAESESLKAALISSLEAVLQVNPAPIVALSGGIDSLLLACLLKDILGRAPATATLVTHLPGYCEKSTTLRMAERLNLDQVEVVEVREEDFVAALPAVVSACEVPLYNLHPVSKLLFARELKKRNLSDCITGDGADQIASGKISWDYLPLVPTLFANQGVNLHCPFLDPAVMSLVRSRGPDSDKKFIRRLASAYLPQEFLQKSKRPCFTPPMNLSRHQTHRTFAELPEECGIPLPDEMSDRDLTFWTTLSLLENSHLRAA